jgi:hypothetical protein
LKNLSLFRSWSFRFGSEDFIFRVDFWFRIRPSAGSFRSFAGGSVHLGLRSGVGLLLGAEARPGYISVKSALGLPLPKTSPEATAPPFLFSPVRSPSRNRASVCRFSAPSAVGGLALPKARHHRSFFLIFFHARVRGSGLSQSAAAFVLVVLLTRRGTAPPLARV